MEQSTAGKIKDRTVIDRIWSLFTSIKLAVVVFTIISLTSIVGTIVEQQADPQRNIKLLAKFFGDASAPGVFRVLDALGFTDMFHSWWFLVLIFAFAANLVICSLERLPKIWRVVKEPVKPLTAQQFSSMSIKREAVIKEKAEKVTATVEAELKKAGFKPKVDKESGFLQIYSEKGRYGRLGLYVTHFSILLILTGAVVGIFAGFNGFLNLLEGTTSTVAYMRNGKEIPLGFEIRCDDFDVSFYENSDTPKSFRSWLTIFENGREVLKQDIEVNTPLRYRGITFYQSSYGFSPSRDALYKFTVTGRDGKKEDVQVKFGETFSIPGSKLTAKVADFSPALGLNDKGRLFTYAETMNNPAAFLEFTEGGAVKNSQWILKRFPETWKTPEGVIEFKDLWGAQYTGLQVRKDPGVWIVYLGCLVMAVGLYAAFFMSHRRVWVGLVDQGGKVQVTIAGFANKNRLAFEQKIDRILKGIQS
ncbi:MAG: cytochrome c biogenesis protein ResB [Chloroflexota bacterium]